VRIDGAEWHLRQTEEICGRLPVRGGVFETSAEDGEDQGDVARDLVTGAPIAPELATGDRA
jgi:hypothetical protein